MLFRKTSNKDVKSFIMSVCLVFALVQMVQNIACVYVCACLHFDLFTITNDVQNITLLHNTLTVGHK
jgi:hypothetical protein